MARFPTMVSYALTADNNPWKVLDPSVPPEEAGNYPDSAYSYHVDEYLSAAVNLGGPIIKDSRPSQEYPARKLK
jgi:hypothetical protein